VLKILLPLQYASKKRLSIRKRRTQKSEILMSSPFKNDLKENTKDSRKLPKTTKSVKSLSNNENPTPEPHSHDLETECIICGESFDEEWIQCITSKDWAHGVCVDINPADLYYNCDVCVAKNDFVLK